LHWKGHEIVLVSDIGCSGLFDTYFNTHAVHGLHGRALTYAVGIKMARPGARVVVTMGDGGLGIGMAHVVSACRRNIGITLLVLDNFTFGMTGGQFSPTTPTALNTASGFLNALEKPLDICLLAAGAGAGHVNRLSVYDKELPEKLAAALAYEGFSLVDLQGVCTGRMVPRNRITPRMIDASVKEAVPARGQPGRDSYEHLYRELASRAPEAPAPIQVHRQFDPVTTDRQEVLILGRAGQRIATAGEILCLAGMSAGLQVTKKTDYPITVLRGHSISEVVLSPEKIGFTGIEAPGIVLALSREGVARRAAFLQKLSGIPLVILAKGVAFPDVPGERIPVAFDDLGIKPPDWALASLGILAVLGHAITVDMLGAALAHRFEGKTLESARALVATVTASFKKPP
jgi:pyruvate/2-oxoacid:ferredoxin oxidoreductase beta subunit